MSVELIPIIFLVTAGVVINSCILYLIISEFIENKQLDNSRGQHKWLLKAGLRETLIRNCVLS